MKTFVILLLTLTLFTSGLLVAGSGDTGSDTLKLSLQIRHRFEMNAKDFDSDTDPNNYNLMRTRLSLTFKPMKNVMGFFQAQDSRLWGEETSTLGDGSADNLDVHQAYFKVNKLFGLNMALKLGRMEVVYGPQRLIGAVGWHNIGRSFDGFILTFKGKKASVDLFSFKEVENLEVGDIGDKNVFGFYGDFKLFKNHTTQAFLIWQLVDPSDALSRYTLGIYDKGKSGGFRHELELAYQGGKILGLDVSAFMAALNVGYTFSGSIAPDLSGGIDWLSGDDDGGDGEFNVFDTLYATNHKYYGYMDYFLNIPAHTFGLGLMDIHAGLSIKPSPKTSLALKYHNFQAVKDAVLNSGATSKNFGSEFDFTFKLKYNKALSFVAGASIFTPGDVFKERRGQDTSSWFYLMTIFNVK
ncbi:MAG: alginate export family protein [bacterium]|nr:alginate export family protein [bacterium]